jgi:enoyl-CoA hydratase
VAFASLEKIGPVAVLRLCRPEARNAIDIPTMQEIRAALTEIESDTALRATILTAEGSVFCAGMDLASFIAGDWPGITDPDRFAGFAGAVRRKPVIAAVNGPALAGGMEIVLACEIVLAVPQARFGLPEVQLGLIAAGGGAVRLPQRIPPAIAAEMLLTGDPIGAERAAELGLVNRIVPPEDLMETAMAVARRIAAASPDAIAATMQILRESRKPAETAGWAATDRFWPEIATSENAQEGPRAFLEKRAPVYRDPD